MRCGCRICEAFMIQSESDRLGCVCPECGYRCADCLGTDTVVPRDRLAALAGDPRFSPESILASLRRTEEDDDSEKYPLEASSLKEKYGGY